MRQCEPCEWCKDCYQAGKMATYCFICRRNSKKNRDVSFFRFPKDEERCATWLQAALDFTGRPKLPRYTSDYCYKNLKVCAKHFEEKMFAGMSRSRLNLDAMPVLRSPHGAAALASIEGNEILQEGVAPNSKNEINITSTISSSKGAVLEPPCSYTKSDHDYCAPKTSSTCPEFDYIDKYSRCKPHAEKSLVRIDLLSGEQSMNINTISLPVGYTYLLNEENDNGELFEFRIKEIENEEMAEAWFKEYCKNSPWIWRVVQTFPRSGRINLFKKKYRCDRNVCFPRKENPKRKRVSKHTGCPATFAITVKRHMKKSRSKNRQVHGTNKEWPCCIEMFHQHNHEIPCTLKVQSLSEDQKTYLSDLKEQTTLNPKLNEIYIIDGDSENNCLRSMNTPVQEIQVIQATEDKVKLSEDAFYKLDKVVERIRAGVATEPEVFIPAVNQMVNNVDRFIKSDRDLLSAMCTFGTANAKKKTDKHGLKVHPQPSSAIRRKCLTTEERDSILHANKHLLEIGHDYTTLIPYDL